MTHIIVQTKINPIDDLNNAPTTIFVNDFDKDGEAEICYIQGCGSGVYRYELIIRDLLSDRILYYYQDMNETLFPRIVNGEFQIVKTKCTGQVIRDFSKVEILGIASTDCINGQIVLNWQN